MIEKFDLILFGTCIAISYAISLREAKGLMLNLSTMIKYLRMSEKYVVIALKGKVKGESYKQDHLFSCIPTMSSRIQIKTQIELLELAQRAVERHGRPGIMKADNTMTTINELDLWLHLYLSRLYDDKVKFPQEIKNEDDIIDRYSVFQSLR